MIADVLKETATDPFDPRYIPRLQAERAKLVRAGGPQMRIEQISMELDVIQAMVKERAAARPA